MSIREILIVFLAGGHCLLRGVPGLAKTLLIKKLSGGEVVIRAAVRPTEFDQAAGAVSLPPVGADVIDPRGGSVPVRLWPGAKRGLFEGRFRPAMWWAVAFASLLCAEWALRRRSTLR